MARTGRPTKRTPERTKLILDGLKAGLTRAAAAGLAGVHPSLVNHWCRRFPAFSSDVAIAEAEAEAKVTGVLLKAMQNGSWRAAESWLKRRRRAAWGDSIRVEELSDEQILRLIALEEGGGEEEPDSADE